MTASEPGTTLHRATGTWPLVHAERAALAADLLDLAGEQWATPSLCAGPTVREVLAHLTAGASLSPVRWLAGVIRCRFDFDRQVAMRLAEQLGATPADTLDRFRAVLTSTTKPPLPTRGAGHTATNSKATVPRPCGSAARRGDPAHERRAAEAVRASPRGLRTLALRWTRRRSAGPPPGRGLWVRRPAPPRPGRPAAAGARADDCRRDPQPVTTWRSPLVPSWS
jgi:uncharacterized protein (TIGR03083 family)